MAAVAEAEPIALDPDIAARSRELQAALARILRIHISDLEALLVASSMRP